MPGFSDNFVMHFWFLPGRGSSARKEGSGTGKTQADSAGVCQQ